RYLTRLGINILVYPLCLWAAVAAAIAAAAARRACAAALRRALAGRDSIGLPQLAGHHVAAVDPDLDADGAIGGAGDSCAEIDIGGERAQGHPAPGLPFPAGHFRAAQPAGDVAPDALGPRLHGALDGQLHGPLEGHALLQLLGDVPGHQYGGEIGLA